MVQMKARGSEGDLLCRTHLRDYLAYLAAEIDLSYDRPTAAQERVFKQLDQQAKQAQEKLRTEPVAGQQSTSANRWRIIGSHEPVCSRWQLLAELRFSGRLTRWDLPEFRSITAGLRKFHRLNNVDGRASITHLKTPGSILPSFWMQKFKHMPVPALFVALLVTCLDVGGINARAGQNSAWIPEGIEPGGILNRNKSIKFTGLACNAVSFGCDPSLGDYCIGRELTQGCRGPWSLVLSRIDWPRQRIEYVQHVLDTRNGPVPISGGEKVRNAYDAQVMAWNDEIWVAFECTGQGINRASTCMGPLRKDLTLDTRRTNVVIQGADDGTYHYSASVPKLLAYHGRAYIYWDRLKWKWVDHKLVAITAWGVEIKKGSDGKFWAIDSAGHTGRSMNSNDPAAAEVFGLDVSDPRSNGVADLFQTTTDGHTIYITGARGGRDCTRPGDVATGCYRLTIGKTTDPLGYHVFNQHLIPDEFMPESSAEYYRFVYRPDDGKTALLGGMLRNPQHIPGAPVGIWAFIWPSNLFSAAGQNGR